jgi:hypothetical protein
MFAGGAAADASPAAPAATATLLSHSVSISNSISPALRDCYHPSKQPYPNTYCKFITYSPGEAR